MEGDSSCAKISILREDNFETMLTSTLPRFLLIWTVLSLCGVGFVLSHDVASTLNDETSLSAASRADDALSDTSNSTSCLTAQKEVCNMMSGTDKDSLLHADEYMRRWRRLTEDTHPCAPSFSAFVKQLMIHYDLCPFLCQFDYEKGKRDLKVYNGETIYSNCLSVDLDCKALFGRGWKAAEIDCRKSFQTISMCVVVVEEMVDATSPFPYAASSSSPSSSFSPASFSSIIVDCHRDQHEHESSRLTDWPLGLPKNATRILLNDNKIKYLRRKDLILLTNLSFLDLSNNKLEKILVDEEEETKVLEAMKVSSA